MIIAKKTAKHTSLVNISATVVMVVMAVLPFHGFFTSWVGSNIGHLDLIRIWKEIVLFTLVPGLIYVAWSDVRLRQWFNRRWLVRAVLAYTTLHFLLAWLAYTRGEVNRVALIYGLIINLRFFGFFILVIIIAGKTEVLRNRWRSYILLPALVVISFGLLQLALPHDFLRHFGYGSSTIPSFQTVDQKLSFRRIQSTLRGANPLGAYMLFILPLLLLVRGKAQRLLALVLGAIVMFFSYSRSAVLGLLATAMFLVRPLVVWGKRTVFVIALGVVGVALAILVVRDNNIAQNTFFHTDETSKSAVSSNSNRLKEMKKGVTDVLREPLGRGPGTAGPASFRNDYPARIAENYFIQIGQEVGILGLGLFLTIQFFICQALWKNRKDALSKVMLALLIGLSVVNLVSHAWTDDTVSYLYWGLVAVALSPAFTGLTKKLPHPKTK